MDDVTADQDEVDRIVDAWQRERPDLDVSPMQILSRVSRLAHHLDRARKAAFSTNELEPWEFDVLAALRRSGEPYALSPGRLVAETFVTSGTMTNRVDRLASRGFVERAPSPQDRRGVLVRLTESGRRSVDNALSELVAHEAELLTSLDPLTRERVVDALRLLTQPFHA